MHHGTSKFSHVRLLLGVCFALGCSKGDSPGCGSGTKSTSGESGETALKVPSTLVGVYEIAQYQKSEGTCDQLVDISEAPSHLVLYPFEPNDGGTTRLGGAFCGEVKFCRAVAKRAAEPTIGYSFIAGDEASGWQGWAIRETGSLENKCKASVQSHSLSPSELDAIQIETKTVEVYFVPVAEEDGVATCPNKHAIAVAMQEQGCKSRLVLGATRKADL